MKKLFRLTKHVIRGTISRRVFFEKVKKNAIAKEDEWNNFINSDTEFIFIDFFDDISFKLYKSSALSKNLFRGDFEFQEIQFLRSFLQEGDEFYDIGANIGYFSIVASKAVGETGKVHSFEPTDETFKRLEESVSLNKCQNITTHQIALSNIKEEREFVISKDGFDAYNSLGTPSSGKDFDRKVVITHSLDSYIEEHQLNLPSLVKIDVEGWEIPVIEGMNAILSNDNAPTLLVEFTEDNAKLSGFSCAKLYELISSHGYSLYEYNWVRNELTKQENRDYYNYTNLICIKDGSKHFKRLKNVSIN